jgi:hypothetical protein
MQKPEEENMIAPSNGVTRGVESAHSEHLLNNGANINGVVLSAKGTPEALLVAALDENESKFMREQGMNDEQIAAFAANRRPKRGAKEKKRVVTVEMISANRAEVVEMAGGKSLLTAKTVGIALTMLDLIPPPLGYQGIGDCLGSLALPTVKIGGKTHYCLNFIGKPSDECEQRSKLLAALDTDVLMTAVGEIKEEAVTAAPAPEPAIGESAVDAEIDGFENNEAARETGGNEVTEESTR